MLGDVLLVARGTVIGQAPFVLVTPIITRIFPATELGIYGVAVAFVGIAAPVVGLRFDLAAISARNSTEARALLLLAALVVVPMTCLSTGVLCVLKTLNIGSYGALSWGLVAATGATVAAAGEYSTLRCWLARHGRFRLLANSLTLQGCLRAVIPTTLAGLIPTAVPLIAGELVSRLSSIALMMTGSGLYHSFRRARIPASVLRAQLGRYWKYPVLLAPSALVDAAATMLPVPILAAYYGLGPAGKFALVQRLIMLPAALIVGSVGDVFHAHATNVAGGDSTAVARFVAATAARLMLFALVVYVPVASVAPFVAGWVFGRQWVDAGPMIALLAPLCVAQTVVSPISRGLLLSGREERKLIADVACLVLPVGALYLARSLPILEAVAWFSLAATAAYGIYYRVIVQTLRLAAAAPPSASRPLQ